jgi:AcrR family transcriptional regulator
VRRVGIPKGTFYLFYDSKELLFYDVYHTYHNELHDKILAEIACLSRGIDAHKLTELIFSLYKLVADSFLLKFMTEGELEMVLRKLPPEIMTKHAEKDDLSIERLLSLVPDLKTDRSRIYSAALRAVFLSMLHKHEIGDEVFDDALKTMIHGVVIQMFGGDHA